MITARLICSEPNHIRGRIEERKPIKRKLKRWSRRFFRYFPPITILIGVVLVAIVAGFIAFVENVTRLSAPEQLKPADAIIVLTGGEKRLETALDLLQHDFGKRLLISGVNPGTNRTTLINATGAPETLFECCIDLGREADNTIGNAVESAEWVKEHHYRSVYIVTNDYHMPRSMLELRRAMPGIKLIAYPTSNPSNEPDSWWRWVDRLRVLSLEYVKFIGAYVLGLVG